MPMFLSPRFRSVALLYRLENPADVRIDPVHIILVGRPQ